MLVFLFFLFVKSKLVVFTLVHVTHAFYRVANLFEGAYVAVHFEIFENVVESDRDAFVEFCNVGKSLKVKARIGDEDLFDRFDVFVLLVRVLQDLANVRKGYAFFDGGFAHSCAFAKLVGVDSDHIIELNQTFGVIIIGRKN